jgi:hypothetical protein
MSVTMLKFSITIPKTLYSQAAPFRLAKVGIQINFQFQWFYARFESAGGRVYSFFLPSPPPHRRRVIGEPTAVPFRHIFILLSWGPISKRGSIRRSLWGPFCHLSARWRHYETGIHSECWLQRI